MKYLLSVIRSRFKAHSIIVLTLLLSVILFYNVIADKSFAQIDPKLKSRILWDESVIEHVGIKIAYPIDWTITTDDNKVKISNPLPHFVETITIINHGSPMIDNLKAMTNVLLKQCMDSEYESSHKTIVCNAYQPTEKSLYVINDEPAVICNL